MSRGERSFVAATAVFGAFLLIMLVLGSGDLSAESKRTIEDTVYDTWPNIKAHYALEQHTPSVEWDEPEHYGGARRAVAVTVCGPPGAIIVFDPDDARDDPHYLATVTLPHELAHAVMCELNPNAPEHGARWKEIALDLGMQEDP